MAMSRKSLDISCCLRYKPGVRIPHPLPKQENPASIEDAGFFFIYQSLFGFSECNLLLFLKEFFIKKTKDFRQKWQ
jgi:hypothetical protein